MKEMKREPRPNDGVRSRYHGECMHCLEVRFLRPMAIFPGAAGPDCMVMVDLCLWCRLDWRDSKWADAIVTWLHHPRREVREAAQWALEWHERVVPQAA